MTDNVNKLIDNYCAKIGLPKETLFITGRKKPKKHNNISICQARISLCYYMITEMGISYRKASAYCGYKDHSTWGKKRRETEFRLKHNDEIITPYYKELLNVAENGQNN